MCGWVGRWLRFLPQEVLEQDLVMAFVSGGSTSKHRRTLSKNLYPDLEACGFRVFTGPQSSPGHRRLHRILFHAPEPLLSNAPESG